VYGLVPFDRDGAAAEYVAVPADHCGARPMSLSHIEAAALPLPALTAQQALFATKYGLAYGTPAWLDDVVHRYGLNLLTR
jgi:NADPH:quinone reductase-like Zn-dependent oxidoreductase